MKRIPYILIYARLLMGLVLPVLSYYQVSHYIAWALTLLTLGLLSDVFDGIIARRLQVSSQHLRRMDSSVDQVFFLGVALATYLQCQDFFKAEVVMLSVLIGFEALTYLISWIKFRKEIATHSFGAKLWTLVLFATLIELMIHCGSGILFSVCFWLGLFTRLEIMAIILILKEWTNDVPTFYHAIQLRRGKSIKRHKMFNG